MKCRLIGQCFTVGRVAQPDVRASAHDGRVSFRFVHLPQRRCDSAAASGAAGGRGGSACKAGTHPSHAPRRAARRQPRLRSGGVPHHGGPAGRLPGGDLLLITFLSSERSQSPVVPAPLPPRPPHVRVGVPAGTMWWRCAPSRGACRGHAWSWDASS